MKDDDVPRFLTDLGLPGLADVHVHFLPPRMMRRVWAHFAEAGPLLGREWPIVYQWPEQERLARLAALGVRHFSALAYAHRPAMAEDLNEWTLDFAGRVPGCLPSATFYPEPGALRYLDTALARGAAIIKLHLQVGGFDPNDPLLDPVWGRLAETGTPVVVHAGSGPVPNRYTGPAPIGRTLDRYPGLTMIIAHLGAPEYHEFFELTRRHPRLHLDTTMAFTDFFTELAPFPAELRPHLRDLGLAGRILLGSDFPNIPHPYAHQLDALARLDLGDDWLRAVCWTNPVRLFQLADTC